jgi:hypothetical protein
MAKRGVTSQLGELTHPGCEQSKRTSSEKRCEEASNGGSGGTHESRSLLAYERPSSFVLTGTILGTAAEGDMHHFFSIQILSSRLARRSEFSDLSIPGSA